MRIRLVIDLNSLSDPPLAEFRLVSALKNSAGRYHNTINFILPEWVRHGLNDRVQDESPSNGRTAYLNGLRGVASLLVFIRHFILPWYSAVDYGFHQTPETTSILRLPIIRALYSGPNVPIFLVVSGYVISLKPLTYLHQGNQHLAWESLASSTLRRGFRMLGPPLFTSFVVMILIRLNMFDFPYATMPGHIPTHPERASSLLMQLNDWAAFLHQDLLNPWKWSTGKFVYGPHLWTVPLQFRCSMVLFLCLVAFGRVRSKLRLFSAPLLVFVCFLSGRWDVALSLYGMFLADLDVSLRGKGVQNLLGKGERLPMRRRYWNIKTLTTGACLMIGLYFASFPRHSGPRATFGYGWTHWITADYHYWHALSAIFLTLFLGQCTTAQKIFSGQFTQYLGRRSFSLYIVHEPLLHVFGFRVVSIFWRMTDQNTKLGYNCGVAFALIVTLAILLWISDIFQRVIDEPWGRLVDTLERGSRQ